MDEKRVLFRLSMEIPLLQLEPTGSPVSRRDRAESLMLSCPTRCYPSAFKLS